MPYVEPGLRTEKLKKAIDAVEKAIKAKLAQTQQPLQEKLLAKMLTYVTFKLMRDFYAGGNWYFRGDVDKILASVSDEFHRRFCHSAEQEALKRNGDV